MAKVERYCKICDKPYIACYTVRQDPSVFRWEDVACCEEHGREYLRRVMVARGLIQEEPVVAEVAEDKEEIPTEKESATAKPVRAKKRK